MLRKLKELMLVVEIFTTRKGKFGMNLLATRDCMCRFVDVYLSHSNTTSDYLAFRASELRGQWFMFVWRQCLCQLRFYSLTL